MVKIIIVNLGFKFQEIWHSKFSKVLEVPKIVSVVPEKKIYVCNIFLFLVQYLPFFRSSIATSKNF